MRPLFADGIIESLAFKTAEAGLSGQEWGRKSASTLSIGYRTANLPKRNFLQNIKSIIFNLFSLSRLRSSTS